MIRKTTTLAMALTASLMIAQPATAQSQGNVTPEMLQQFAEVNKEVAQVANQFRGQAQSAQDKQARQEMARKAQEAMASVVKESPMTVAEYNQVITQLQQDKQLKQRYEQMMGK